jgi:hypothetical protein
MIPLGSRTPDTESANINKAVPNTTRCTNVEAWNDPIADSLMKELVLMVGSRKICEWRENYLSFVGSPNELVPAEMVSACLSRLAPTRRFPVVCERGLALYCEGGKSSTKKRPCLVLGPASKNAGYSSFPEIKKADAKKTDSKNAPIILDSCFRRFNIIRLANIKQFRTTMDQLGP